MRHIASGKIIVSVVRPQEILALFIFKVAKKIPQLPLQLCRPLPCERSAHHFFSYLQHLLILSPFSFLCQICEFFLTGSNLAENLWTFKLINSFERIYWPKINLKFSTPDRLQFTDTRWEKCVDKRGDEVNGSKNISFLLWLG